MLFPTLPAPFSIGAMNHSEAEQLLGWAAAEGWNPGQHDLDVAWNFDLDAFVALRALDALVGGGAIVSYGGKVGFMGLFIVHPDYRGRGLGTPLWFARRDQLRARLAPNAPILMDGVPGMVPFYERGGFRVLYDNLRYEGVAEGQMDPFVVPLSQVPFSLVDAFDQQHVPAPRSTFLRAWTTQPGTRSLALVEDGQLRGFGCARPCVRGFKLGPVFAANEGIANRLLDSLLSTISGSFVQLDVPEPNRAARDFAESRGWTSPFSCARMVLGEAPSLPLHAIFGVTSFEFGG